MVTCVTQNFQVIDEKKKANAKPLLFRKKSASRSSSRLDVVPKSLLAKRGGINNLEQPITKFSAKPSMLLPKSVVKVEQSPIEFFQSYNDNLYDLLVKTKRRNLIAKYQASQASLKSDSFIHQTNGSSLSDKMCSPYEDERLSSFLHNITNKRRKTALSNGYVRAQSAKLRRSETVFENYSAQKPVHSAMTSKPPSPILLMSSQDNFNQLNDDHMKDSYDFFEAVDHVVAKSSRPQTVTGSIDTNKLHNGSSSRTSIKDRALTFINYLKVPRHDVVEPADSPGNDIKLYSEKFLRMLQPKTVPDSTPVDTNRSSDSQNDNIDSFQGDKNVKNRWKLNQDVLNELANESMEEMLELEKLNALTEDNHKHPSPSPDFLMYNDSDKLKKKTKLIVRINSTTPCKSPIRTDSKRESELSKASTKTVSDVESERSKQQKSTKKKLKKPEKKEQENNFLTSAIVLTSVQTTETTETPAAVQEKEDNSNNNLNELLKMRENQKRAKASYNKYENQNLEVKAENIFQKEPEEIDFEITTREYKSVKTSTAKKSVTIMDAHSEPQTFMGKLYNTEGSKSVTSSAASTVNQKENVNKLFLTKRIPLTNSPVKKVEKKDDSQSLYVKQSIIDMLDFELTEAKKDDLTLQSVLNSIKDVRVNNTIGRLALSKSVCRFELPMDMKLLESMEPSYYITHYCKINDRRKSFYKRIFDRYKIKSEKEDYIDLNLLEECLMEVHMKSINENQYNLILKLVSLPPNTQINFILFAGIAALSERVLYSQFVTEDTMDLPDYQKDKIECADFGSLKSKLEGIRISEMMLTLLQSL